MTLLRWRTDCGATCDESASPIQERPKRPDHPERPRRRPGRGAAVGLRALFGLMGACLWLTRPSVALAQAGGLEVIFEHGGHAAAGVVDGPRLFVAQGSRIHAMAARAAPGDLVATSEPSGDIYTAVGAQGGLVVAVGSWIHAYRLEENALRPLGRLPLREASAVEQVVVVEGRAWLRTEDGRWLGATFDEEGRPTRVGRRRPSAPEPGMSARVEHIALVPNSTHLLLLVTWMVESETGLTYIDSAQVIELDIAHDPPLEVGRVDVPTQIDGFLVTDGRHVVVVDRLVDPPPIVQLLSRGAGGLEDLGTLQWAGIGTYDAVMHDGSLWRVDLEGQLHRHDALTQADSEALRLLARRPVGLLALPAAPAILDRAGPRTLDRRGEPRPGPVLETAGHEFVRSSGRGAWLLEADGRLSYTDGETGVRPIEDVLRPGGRIDGLAAGPDHLLLLRLDAVEAYRVEGAGRLRYAFTLPRPMGLVPKHLVGLASSRVLLLGHRAGQPSAWRSWLQPLFEDPGRDPLMLGDDMLIRDAIVTASHAHVWASRSGTPGMTLQSFELDSSWPNSLGLLGVPTGNNGRVGFDEHGVALGVGSSVTYLDLSDPSAPRELDQIDLPAPVRTIARSGDLAWVAWAGGGRAGLSAIDLARPDRLREVGQGRATTIIDLAADAQSAWLVDDGILRRYARPVEPTTTAVSRPPPTATPTPRPPIATPTPGSAGGILFLPRLLTRVAPTTRYHSASSSSSIAASRDTLPPWSSRIRRSSASSSSSESGGSVMPATAARQVGRVASVRAVSSVMRARVAQDPDVNRPPVPPERIDRPARSRKSRHRSRDRRAGCALREGRQLPSAPSGTRSVLMNGQNVKLPACGDLERAHREPDPAALLNLMQIFPTPTEDPYDEPGRSCGNGVTVQVSRRAEWANWRPWAA